MSLDIGVGNGSSFVPVQGEPALYLDDDGYYWFLHPLFARLQAETGQYIDLYGDAAFTGPELASLKLMLAEARTLAEAQTHSWQVHVGTQVAPVRRELYKPVRRDKLLALLDRWDEVVCRAAALNRPVVCFGD